MTRQVIFARPSAEAAAAAGTKGFGTDMVGRCRLTL